MYGDYKAIYLYYAKRYKVRCKQTIVSIANNDSKKTDEHCIEDLKCGSEHIRSDI